ncbi:hypothetical protein [Streptomyces sp. ODS28]|uniref:VMAP-C domain-containing protein n=1 Tax=Streptomyces sp. ODS28 TaxID=3136688 RepID=UPI0031E9FFE5
MSEAAALLGRLVKRATVRISGEDGRFWGSGFLVAPGWVLTAAHVLRDGLGEDSRGAPGGSTGASAAPPAPRRPATARGPRFLDGVPAPRTEPGPGAGDACSPDGCGWLRRTVLVALLDEEGEECEVPARVGYWPPGVPARRGEQVPADADFALLRLDGTGPRHHCVWLSDRAALPTAESELTAYGWYEQRGRLHAWTGNFACGGEDAPYGIRLGPDSQIPRGVSGGPVVDTARGAVVGLVKRNSTDSSGGIALGGLAVSTAVLRALDEADPLCAHAESLHTSQHPDQRPDPHPDPHTSQHPDPYTRSPALDPYAELMRRHDRWHAEELAGAGRGWASLQEELGRGAGQGRWTPGDRAELLGIFGELPDPGDQNVVKRLVKAALIEDPGPLPHGLRTLRDGHGCLYEDDVTYEELPFLRYARLAALWAEQRSPGAGEPLRGWLERRVQRLRGEQKLLVNTVGLPEGLPSGTVPGEGPTALLELELAHYSGGRPGAPPAFHAYLRGQTADGTGPAYEKVLEPRAGIPEPELVGALRQWLREMFRELDTPQRKAPLEVSLPQGHFDLPVQRWLLYDVVPEFGTNPAYQPLGVQRQVMVRAQSRRVEQPPEDGCGGAGEALPDERWRSRWEQLAGAARLSALRLPPSRAELSEERLRHAPAGSVLTLCRPAGDDHGRHAMGLAVDSGHGVVLWHSGAHPGGRCEERCDELHRGLARTVRSVGSVRELPEHIRALRARVLREDPAARWAGKVAILYDDATRPLYAPASEEALDSPP